MESSQESTSFGQCRCCLAKGNHQDLMKEHNSDGASITYSDVFADCFNVFLSTDVRITTLICTSCVQQLRNALSFKTKALESEKLLLKSINKENDKETVFLNCNVASEELKAELSIKEEETNDVGVDVEYESGYCDQGMNSSREELILSLQDFLDDCSDDGVNDPECSTPKERKHSLSSSSSLCSLKSVFKQSSLVANHSSSISSVPITTLSVNKLKETEDLHISNGKKRSRNKRANPSNWQQTKAKILRNLGMSYVSTSKNKRLVPERRLKEPCTNTCRLKCTKFISEDKRKYIFDSFWALGDLQRQREYIARHLSIVKPKYSYKVSNRSNNFAFHLTVDDQKIRVCKQFFRATLDISDKPIQTVISKMNENGFGIVTPDRRGKHENHKCVDIAIKNAIRQHIQSIPKFESHCCRESKGRQYIEGSKTIADLYKDYVNDCKVKGISYGNYIMYNRIFKSEFDLSFHTAKTERCGKCAASRTKSIESDAHLTETEIKDDNIILLVTNETQDLELPSMSVDPIKMENVDMLLQDLIDECSDDSAQDPDYGTSKERKRSSSLSSLSSSASLISISKQSSLTANSPVSQSNQTEDFNLSNEKRKRKKVADPSNWRKNKGKILRNSGESYISCSNKKHVVPKRRLRAPCPNTCRLKCTEFISEDKRQSIFDSYWAMSNLQIQREYIARHLRMIKPKYTFKVHTSNRGNNFAFFLTVDDQRIRVCKQFFRATLDISNSPIRTVIEKMRKSGIGTVAFDIRGKHENHKSVDNAIKNAIRQHIESIPQLESHCCEASKGKKYIEGNKTITDLHKDYVNDCKAKGISYGNYITYSKIFKSEFNLLFRSAKTDGCDNCAGLRSQVIESDPRPTGSETKNDNNPLLDMNKTQELELPSISVDHFTVEDSDLLLQDVTDDCSNDSPKDSDHDTFKERKHISSSSASLKSVSKQPPSISNNSSNVPTVSLSPFPVSQLNKTEELNLSNRKRKRKKQADPSNWQQTKAKVLRNLGKSYISNRKRLVPERRLKEPCTNTCRLKCTELISEDKRQCILDNYWAMGDLQKQREYIAEHLRTVKPRYCYKIGNRSNNYAFYLTVDDLRIRVCKQFFRTTLDISDNTISTVIRKMNESGSGIVTPDRRGKHKNHKSVDIAIKNNIRQHIQSVPTFESHCCRESKGRQFIEGNKAITDLHKDYVNDCKLKGISYGNYSIYSQIFKSEFNINSSNVDLCEYCAELRTKKRKRKTIRYNY